MSKTGNERQEKRPHAQTPSKGHPKNLKRKPGPPCHYPSRRNGGQVKIGGTSLSSEPWLLNSHEDDSDEGAGNAIRSALVAFIVQVANGGAPEGVVEYLSPSCGNRWRQVDGAAAKDDILAFQFYTFSESTGQHGPADCLGFLDDRMMFGVSPSLFGYFEDSSLSENERDPDGPILGQDYAYSCSAGIRWMQ